MMWSLLLSLVFSAAITASGRLYENRNVDRAIPETNATLYYHAGKYVYKPGEIDAKNGVAHAIFKDGLMINGWGVLDVVSGYGAESADDEKTMYAAGFLEGSLTYKQIYMHQQNMVKLLLGDQKKIVIRKLQSFMYEQQEFMEKMVAEHKEDPFWRNVGLILAQYNGLVDGYYHAAPGDMKVDDFTFLLLNGAGDVMDIINAVHKEGRPNFNKMTPDQVELYVQRNSHCSALIKVLGGYENILFGQSTWMAYTATNRIYKHYNFNIKEFASKKTSFSSYPGGIESEDDFYLMGNNMAMLQTSNIVFNMSLYDYVKPQSVPAWIRVRVANQMSSSAGQWGTWIQKFNSGTYNNQYMVLDLKKVKLNESIEDGALSVVEQIPGLVEWADQTHKLRLGYWPSYNIPYFESIFNLSGYPAMVKKMGLDYTYQLAPRAKIFRRDAAKVTDMDSMKHIMRYNDYKNDPYSEGKPSNQICSRYDLLSRNPTPMGCYDTKVSDFHLASQMTALAVNGPTKGDHLPAFSWSQFTNTSHVGLPETYDFPFLLMSPLIN